MRKIRYVCGLGGALGLALIASVACTSRSAFVCLANEQCVSETNSPGICEANKVCSFPDTACAESGRRYPDGAGESLAFACVAAPASTKCIAHITLGKAFGCILKNDGSVWCWGDNTNGQLGDGTNVARLAPTRVALPSGVTAASVVSGEAHTCILSTEGTVWCWGLNGTYQLGVGTDDSNVPVNPVVQMTVQPMPSAPPTTVTVTVTALSAGGKHTCAVADKLVYCWGENSDGECGLDPQANDDVKTPALVTDLEGITALSIGDEFSCALKDDKSVWCWGANANGELGNGSTVPTFKPEKASISSVAQIAAGDEHACSVKDDGSVFCWGYGQSGAIGNRSTMDQPSPVAVTTATAVASAGESFHTCATQIDGTLLCWGENDAAQLGAGRDEPNVLAPVVVNLVTIQEVALGGKHTCAVTLDGALWCWGANDVGQLGLGTKGAPEKSPKRVPFSCGP